jgi:predicted nucleic acid-binding protein
MKVLFDTNVVLDVLLDRKPFSEPAAQLLSYAESGEIEASLCATALTTISYLAAKAIGRHAAQEQVRDLLKLFDVAPVNRLVLEGALEVPLSDFEDAVVLSSAYHAGVDALVTRNLRDFKNSRLPVHTPEELLKILI